LPTRARARTPQIKSTINGFLSDQMRAIWNTWLVIQVLLFAFTICAIAAASDTSASRARPPAPPPRTASAAPHRRRRR
jgi:hypothetical protein